MKLEKVFFAVSPRTDELKAVQEARPDHVLLSFGLWSKKDIQKDFVDVIGYRPETILFDSGAVTFYHEAEKNGTDNAIAVALDAMIERHRRAWALHTPIGFSAWRMEAECDGDDEAWEDVPRPTDFDSNEEFADALLEYFEENDLDEYEMGGVGQVEYIVDRIKAEVADYQRTGRVDSVYTAIEAEYTLFHKYVAYIQHNGACIDHTINMDVIGDAEASALVQEILTAVGANPVPVFGFFDDMSVLDKYVAAGHTYIMLGGSKDQKPSERIAWANEAAKRHPEVNFHLLGTLDARIMEAVADNIFSVDGTAWNATRKERRYEGRTKVEQSAWNIRTKAGLLDVFRAARMEEEDRVIGALFTTG